MKRYTIGAMVAVILVSHLGGLFALGDVEILRGDVNGDGSVNVTDVISLSNYLFQGGTAPPCMDAADVNDDGVVNVSDISYLTMFLYQSGPWPPSAYPTCDEDPTEDSLGCVNPCP